MSVLSILEDGFSRAWAQLPRRECWLALAGRRVRMRLAGARLGPLWNPVWVHLLTTPPVSEEAELDIELYEVEELPVELPSQNGFFGDSRFYYERIHHLAAVLDREQKRVVGAVCPARVSNYEAGRPLLPWLSVWLRDQGMLLLHAAACDSNGRAFLFAGPSGSGKSTCALNAWRSGLRFLGEDVVAIEPAEHETFSVHGMYGSIYLTPTDLRDRYPAMSTHGRPPRYDFEDKVMIGLAALGAERLSRSALLSAVLLPRVAKGAYSGLQMVSRARALLGLAPSSMQMGPVGLSEFNFDLMARVVAATPCWALELGGDAAEFVPAIPSRLGTVMA
jgi:hypothetical protein